MRFPCVLLLAAFAASAQPEYVRRQHMIPVRDGVRLNTQIFTPKNAAGPLPFLMVRTPYGVPKDDEAMLRTLTGGMKELAAEQYIFVYQDIRGKFLSEGEFVMQRPPRNPADPKAVDEASDTYDTIDWLLKNIPGHNGRVGITGVSYGGWLTVLAAIDPHPALKAVSPQASPDDMFLGDDFHHNGAFRLAYGFEYVAMMEAAKDVQRFQFDRADIYDWFLRTGSLANVAGRILKGRFPTWTDFTEHPNLDDFWKRQKVSPYIRAVKVPNLNVAGWWDQEDFYGPMAIYQAFEKHDRDNRNFLVVGPWNHGGWMGQDGASLGPIQFGSNTSQYFRQQIMAPWFAYWLKDKGKLDLPEALTFRAGANVWRRHTAWPPPGESRKLYFHASGKLAFQPPQDAAGYDRYISDPNRPVPYRPRPIAPTFGPGSTWRQWLVDDQRHVHMRPDVLSWETEPLAEDLALSGAIVARLYASTSQGDADWVVKLIDVYPEEDSRLPGYQLMVANDVFRGRFRKSFEKPEPLRPNHAYDFTISLHTQDYAFRKGHRIMVQVQSTWFPLIDRNPQKYVPNIFQARDSDFVAAEHRVYRTSRQPSHVEIQVDPR
ncbi:MAG: CocE/NonD family hydrolase [Bryobacteraceae bacterium]|nr:CocE/NonD family hydrolase [Bryobacteraceae bacterium]